VIPRRKLHVESLSTDAEAFDLKQSRSRGVEIDRPALRSRITCEREGQGFPLVDFGSPIQKMGQTHLLLRMQREREPRSRPYPAQFLLPRLQSLEAIGLIGQLPDQLF